MKKLSLLTLGVLATAMMSGCSSSKYTIGVLLPVEHEALQLAEKGFIEGLLESGLTKDQDYVIDEKNAGGDEASLQTLAKNLSISSDMTLGLGTGATKALKSASIDNGKTSPILFTAVTDPVAAKLVDSLDNGTGYVTGASDAQPVLAQLSLIKEINPAADKIGVLYTQSEENSVEQAKQVKSLCSTLLMEVETRTVSGPSDISTVANALASIEGIDAIYVPTDNNIAANMSAVRDACNANSVLCVCGEFGEVKTGGHISYSFDYEMLGKETGKLAAQIIRNGKSAKDLPVVQMTADKCEIKYSSANLAGSGIELPESITSKGSDISK